MINRKQTTFVIKKIYKKKKKTASLLFHFFVQKRKEKRDNFPFIPLILNFIFLGDNKLPFNLRYTYL